MATIADNGYPTLAEIVKTLKPDGTVETQVAELLTKKLPLLEDIPWIEGNLPTGHQIQSRDGLPSPKWRKINQGITPSKSSRTKYDEACGMLEDYHNVDVDAAALGGNPAAYRQSEFVAFLEGFSQEVERSIFYESTLDSPDRIHGLTPRYPATTGYTSSNYVKKGTNGGSNCHSVWLIDWNPDRMFGIFPKGSVAGLKQSDMGIQLIQNTNGGQLKAYVTHFQWKCGLAVKDYRHAVRFQWDHDDASFADSAKGLYLAMQNMLDTVFETEGHRRFYMNRTSSSKLNAQLLSNEANALQYLELGKRRIPHFMGVPIRLTDTLVAETAIS